MFADVNICKSRCWARADWGPPEGLEEALFTCSEECCPAWTLLYLSGTRGSQHQERWAALSLSKVSTSQYQQRSTMWATWEEEMEFLLVLLRRSQTHSQYPLVPLIAWAELKDRGPWVTRAVLFILGVHFFHFRQCACDHRVLLLHHSWVRLWLFKISQSSCSGSISALLSMQWFFFHLHRPAAEAAVPAYDRTVSRFDNRINAWAHRRNLYHTFDARRSTPRPHWRAWGVL